MLNFFDLKAQTTITGIYGDGYPAGSTDIGFFQSTTASRKTYDDSNNLIGFTSGGVTYSTGVNDSDLGRFIGNSNYTPALFTAFPIPSTIINPSNALIGIGTNWGNDAQDNSSDDYIEGFSPIIPSSFVRDGERGLELATNYFNIPSQTITYDALVINQTISINDAEPDLIVTQTGAPGNTDTFRFVDVNGNTVGVELDVSFSGVPRVGGTDWTIYNVTSSTGVTNGTFNGNNGIDTYRDLRMISFKLSDFDITTDNFDEISNFVHITSGNTDIAFTAFNEGALDIFLPDVEIGVSDSSITPDDYCNPTLATFETKITNNSTEKAKDFTVQFNLPAGVDYDANSSVFSPAGSELASYNIVTGEWDVSGLEAGQSVTLIVTDNSISGSVFPLTFNPTASLEFQDDTDTSNNNEVFEALGNDNDCDGVDDTTDLDDDNDGILDTDEGTGDDDMDGIPNNLDLDSDGDQCPDALEGSGTVVIGDLDENFVIPGTLSGGQVNANGVSVLAAAGAGSGQAIGDSQNSGTQTCTTTDTDSDGYIDIVDLDDDNDGILDTVEGITNSLLTDSDSDGCPDALEGDGGFTYSNLDIENRLTGGVDSNGIPLLATSNGQGDVSSTDSGIQSTVCGIPSVMITQVYQTSSGNVIEVTNIGPSTVSDIMLSLFQDGADTGFTPTASVTISSLDSGKSAIIKSVSTISGVTFTNSPNEIENANITDIEGGDDVIVLSTTIDNTSYSNRYDEVKDIENETSIVRIDEVLTYNENYTETEWVKFVSDDIEVVGDSGTIPTISRHVNAPVLSDVESGLTESNSGLGYHVVNSTIRISGAWSNGNPDKSRTVIIQENYDHSGSSLNARKLDVQSNILSIVDNPLIVVNEVNIELGAEIRILGSGQFIQTHEELSQNSGEGKLLINQKSELSTVYRYNYWSLPVSESKNRNTSRVGQILKDAGGELTATSTVQDINFTSGYDGSAGSPITISNYWIWSYFNNTTVDGWVHSRETGYINRGLGYTMKSTGVNPQYFTFSGTPNDGNIGFNIDASTVSLFGNPYPGTLDGRAFILDNQGSIDGSLYFWEHTGEAVASGHTETGYQGGYATLTLSTSVAATTTEGTNGTGGASKLPSRYIAVGQGFFVSSSTLGGTINFNNKQRSYKASHDPIFFKTTQTLVDELSVLKLGMIYEDDNSTFHRQIAVSFNENHSYDFDYGYEANMLDINSTDAYWSFKEMEDKKLVITGVQPISEELQVPLTIAIDTELPVSLQIDSKENISNDIYLYDSLEDTSKIIDDELSLTLEKGLYEDRFFITFSEVSKVLTSIDVVSNTNIKVNLNSIENIINITKNSDIVINEINLYNIYGQKMDIISKQEVNNTTIDVKQLPMGGYFVKVKTNKGVISKKVFKQ